jgi:opacity protein-like surface antigen
MKKVFFVSLFMVMISVGVYAQEQGSKSVGANVVFGSGDEISNTGLQAKFRYSLTDTWRVEGSFIYFFEKSNGYIFFEDDNGFYDVYSPSSTDFSVNLHYCVPVSEQFTIYPLAGLGYMNWNGWYPETEEKTIGWTGASTTISVETGEKAKFSESDFGLNIGAGIDYRITYNISANAELRYRPSSEPFKRTYLSLGICYAF